MKTLFNFSVGIIFIFLAQICAHGQVKISPAPSGAPHSSSMLEVESSSRGFLLPRMSTTERLAIVNPATGLLVYDSTDQVFNYYDGTKWQKIINIANFDGGRNTLNQAYNQGGAGIGRTITGISGAVEINTAGENTSLVITNTTQTGVDVISTTGSAIKAQATDGFGLDVTTGKGAAVLINKTDTGYGLRAFTGINLPKDLVSAKVIGNHTGDYWQEDGRAGYFMIDHPTNNKPALQGYTTGTSHGVLGLTGVQDASSTEFIASSGVTGLSFLNYDRRNGVSGYSKRASGVHGSSNYVNSWSMGPDSLFSGVYGLGKINNSLSGGGAEIFAGTIGYVKSGLGVLGVNDGFGHGVIGITRGSVGGGSQAGVWGMVRDSASWGGHAAAYPFVDGSNAKGRVGILGQAGEDVAMWAESRGKVGLIATVGAKSGIGNIPPVRSAIIGISNLMADGSAAFFRVDTTSRPAVIIESNSTDGALVINQVNTGDGIRLTEPGPGNGIHITMANDTSHKHGLFIKTLNKGLGAQIQLDNPMNSSAGLVVSTFGKGPAASFSILDTSNMEPVVKGVTTGLGSAGLFSIERDPSSLEPSMSPALVARTAGIGRAAIFNVASSISPDPAIEVKTLSPRSSIFSSSNDTTDATANLMTLSGKGHGLEILSTHSTSTTPAALLHVEGEQGFMAHFDDKTVVSGGRTDPVVLISSTAGLGTVGLKITLPVSCLGCKAAEFEGLVEMSKTLKVSGELEVSKIKGEVETDKSFTIGDTLFVKGPASLDGKLNVAGVTTLNGTSTVNANMTVNGTLHATTATASVKMFKIDHPLDDNKFLKHISTESNEALVQYSGNVITNEKGYSIVQMPRYVNALAKDFRYHLTVMGKQFAQAIVDEEINKGGVFKIRTDKPNIKVSWQITGVRQDKFMLENPLVVEEEKGK